MNDYAYHRRSCSLVLDRPVGQVWELVRDFNSYPVWVNGVEDSHIEQGLSGTAVGSVRNYSLGGARRRQRLLAHSDVDRYFTYESCEPFSMELEDAVRTMARYEATLQVRPITEGDRTFAEWTADYACPTDDAETWDRWWTAAIPSWLRSLRDHLSPRQ